MKPSWGISRCSCRCPGHCWVIYCVVQRDVLQLQFLCC
jgi:hypothetical protein